MICSKLGGGDWRLIYRHYATLYFVFCVDSNESELGILDLIQVSPHCGGVREGGREGERERKRERGRERV